MRWQAYSRMEAPASFPPTVNSTSYGVDVVFNIAGGRPRTPRRWRSPIRPMPPRRAELPTARAARPPPATCRSERHIRRRAGGDTAGTVITASYNAATGVLTLTGSDTLAHTSRCSTASPTSTSDNPTDSGADRAGRSRGWSTTARSTRHDQTTTLTSCVDDAPTLGNVATTLPVTEHGADDAVAGCDGQRRRQPEPARRRRCRSAGGTSHWRRAGGDDDRHRHHGELQAATGG